MPRNQNSSQNSNAQGELFHSDALPVEGDRTELEIRIRSHTPFVYIETLEEERCLAEIERVSLGLRRRLWIYSISARNYYKGILHEKVGDPISLLQKFLDWKDYEGVYVLLDFHAVLKDHLARRLFKDAIQLLRRRRCMILIVAPVIDLPMDIQHEAVTLT